MRKRNHVVPVRLNAKELRHLDGQVAKSGLSREEFLRSLILSAQLQTKPCEHHAELLRKIAGLCNNANQLAHVANGTGMAGEASVQEMLRISKETWRLVKEEYIMISFGLVNQEAQAKATVDNGSYAYYSNKDNIFGEHIDDTVYATLEEEFTKVDGSMFFLPRATEGGRYYDTGIVSDKLVSEARCEVVIPCYTYQENNREENLVYEDIDVVAGEVETYYIQDPSYGYKVKLDEIEGKATVVAWSNYFVTIKFNVTGSFKLEVQGYRYKIVEKYAMVSLNARGKTVKWKNPLISNTTMANELAAWLADYYTAGIEYEYDTRGNPELDATDIVYQENEFHDGMRVNIYRHTVNFKQAFSGRVTARRIGG